MPTFTRTYTQEFVDKVLPGNLLVAKDLEGNRHIQAELEALGADEVDGVFQMDSISPKDQIGLMFDYVLWNNHKRKTAEIAAQAATEAANAEAEDDFEGGGTA